MAQGNRHFELDILHEDRRSITNLFPWKDLEKALFTMAIMSSTVGKNPLEEME